MTIPELQVEVPDISTLAFWSSSPEERAAAFAELRSTCPVSLQPAPQATLIPGRPFWAVTRHADVQHVSRHPELFCSGEGVGLADIPVEFLEMNSSFLVMDDPRHTRLRRIVSGAFTRAESPSSRRRSRPRPSASSTTSWPRAAARSSRASRGTSLCGPSRR